MIAFLCAVMALTGSICADHPLPDEKWFSQYDQAPTDATLQYRQDIGDLPMDMSKYAGVIAVPSCKDIAREALVYIKGQWRRVIAFDCLGRDHGNWMEELNVAAELGYYISQDLELEPLRGVKGRLIWISENSQ